MKKNLDYTMTVPEQTEQDDRMVYHIPNATGLPPGAPDTLCGWTDADRYEYHDPYDHPPDCRICLKIVRYCRDIKISYS